MCEDSKLVASRVSELRDDVQENTKLLNNLRVDVGKILITETHMESRTSGLERRAAVLEKMAIDNHSAVTWIKRLVWTVIGVTITGGGAFIWAMITHKVSVVFN